MRLMHLTYTDRDEMQRAIDACTRLFGISDDCLFGIGRTVVRWNKRVKLTFVF